MLLGVDVNKQTGHPYYLCTTIEARNLVINPPKKKRVVIDLKKKEEVRNCFINTDETPFEIIESRKYGIILYVLQEVWAKMASIVPRKWRTLGSELEVEALQVKDSRPLVRISDLFPVEYDKDLKNLYGEENTHFRIPSNEFA